MLFAMEAKFQLVIIISNLKQMDIFHYHACKEWRSGIRSYNNRLWGNRNSAISFIISTKVCCYTAVKISYHQDGCKGVETKSEKQEGNLRQREESRQNKKVQKMWKRRRKNKEKTMKGGVFILPQYTTLQYTDAQTTIEVEWRTETINC